MSEGVQGHRESAPETIRVAVLTISDTRLPETDTGGDVAEELMRGAGHEVVARGIVRDEAASIRNNLIDLLARSDVDVVVTTGGTGISARDTTYEVVDRMIEKKLDGFGELFRMLSYPKIGTSTLQSRADAGVANGTYIFCLPGSPGACRDGGRARVADGQGEARSQGR